MNIPSFGGMKPAIRTKSIKKAVKIAKKPILREKISAPSENSGKNSGKPGVFKAGEERTRLAGAKGGTTKGLNAKVLNETAAVVARAGIPAIVEDALSMSRQNPELSQALLVIAEKATKLVGATFDQSPDAKQKIEVDGKMDNKLEVKISEA